MLVTTGMQIVQSKLRGMLSLIGVMPKAANELEVKGAVEQVLLGSVRICVASPH